MEIRDFHGQNMETTFATIHGLCWPSIAFFGEYFSEESKRSSFNVLIISAAEVAADGKHKQGTENGQIFGKNAKKPRN